MKNRIAKISHLQSIPYNECGEDLVYLNEEHSSFRSDYRRTDTGIKDVIVRRSLFLKLVKIQNRLTQLHSEMQLLVVEGYRPQSYQERYFLEMFLHQFHKRRTFDFNELIEETHQFVALPSVAGHPTGGAIDLTIVCDGKELDMGGQIADFASPQLLPTYSELISPMQLENRLLLHDLMIAEGFAPFYGEWWHFSYGDCEWAAFYDAPKAIYAPK